MSLAIASPVILFLQLVVLYTFALCSGANVKIGVPENYNGIFPWYLSKVRHFTSLDEDEEGGMTRLQLECSQLCLSTSICIQSSCATSYMSFTIVQPHEHLMLFDWLCCNAASYNIILSLRITIFWSLYWINGRMLAENIM